jgi:hypothetical protein
VHTGLIVIDAVPVHEELQAGLVVNTSISSPPVLLIAAVKLLLQPLESATVTFTTPAQRLFVVWLFKGAPALHV